MILSSKQIYDVLYPYAKERLLKPEVPADQLIQTLQEQGLSPEDAELVVEEFLIYSTCRICRHIKEYEMRIRNDPRSEAFPSSVYELQRVKMLSEGKASGWEGPRHLLRCPQCGTYYEHISSQKDTCLDAGDPTWVYDLEYYLRKFSPRLTARQYVHEMIQEFPVATVSGIIIDPNDPAHVDVEVRFPDQDPRETALITWAKAQTRRSLKIGYRISFTLQSSTPESENTDGGHDDWSGTSRS